MFVNFDFNADVTHQASVNNMHLDDSKCIDRCLKKDNPISFLSVALSAERFKGSKTLDHSQYAHSNIARLTLYELADNNSPVQYKNNQRPYCDGHRYVITYSVTSHYDIA